MRLLIILTLFILSSCYSTGNKKELINKRNSDPRFIKKNWKLVWSDEFNGKKLDLKKWYKVDNILRGRTMWSADDTYLDGKGNLILRIRREGNKYFAGSVRSKNLFSKKFGYFEIRCKIPVIIGARSAFWMQPQTELTIENEGRDGTEIDIFESIRAHLGRIQHALHWDKYHKSDSKVLKNRQDIYDGQYHTISLLWTEDSYTFYIDGKQTWKTNAGGVSQVPQYLILSIASKTWEGDITKTKLPKYLIVDYVRVYDLVN